VLDQGAFAASEIAPGSFDGEPLRPYNVAPAALLLNYRAVVYTFVPDAGAGVAHVLVEPPLAGAPPQRSVPLAGGPCADWRQALAASFPSGEPARFAGRYALACGEQTWPVADAAPASYDARLLGGLWHEMGGVLGGRVREGPAPAGTPSFELRSPALAEVVRDINKYSNNVMAEQLFLTLAAEAEPARAATRQAARALVQRWLVERLGPSADGAVIDNGSGLSRDARLSTRLLARLLAAAYVSPVMSELMASLPVTGSDGTLRRARSAAGRAHLKTGSLRDVSGVAGYVLPADGQRLALAVIINHPQAPAGRAAIEAFVQWALARGARDAAGRVGLPPIEPAAAAPLAQQRQ